MESNNISLSVIVIGHNQKELVKRCIESILQQDTSFPVQIIVSDDRSSDGTREMLLEDYKDKVITAFCDSNDIQTSFTLERASYNRLNGLKLATGRYLIHIDGDDFFTGTDLFQSMVDTLESNPDCSMCCQNYYVAKADSLDNLGSPVITHDFFKHDCFISAEEFLTQILYIHNSCVCVRRNCVYTDAFTQKIPYDDNLITARYIGEGKVAILNRCNFVYVQYGNSTCASMSEEEKSLLFLPELSMVKVAPKVAGVVMRRNLGAFSYIAKIALDRVPISDRVLAYFAKTDIFLLQNLNNNISMSCLFRYRLISKLTYLMFALHINSSWAYRLLYRLAIGKPTAQHRF